MKLEEGKAVVTEIVEKWSRIYTKQVFCKQETGNTLQ